MMIKLNKIGAAVMLLTMTTLFSGCSDQFLKDKQDFDKYTEEIYNDYQGAKGRVDWLYYNLLPSSTAGIGFDTPSAGVADDYSKCTEEYGGFSQFVDPTVVMDNTTVPDYIYRENKNISPYGRIRECNMIIEGIKNSTLASAQKKELLGQAFFFRAWCYYRLVKIYGGVPIIDKVQNPMIGNSGGGDLVVPRSTTKACIDFICIDLDSAASYLPASWPDSNYGRVTAGAALAMQGRARVLYASPLFNRANNTDRWEAAYLSNKAAIAKLNEGGFALAYKTAPGTNASGWAKMFSDTKSPEAVFVTLYNTVKTSPGTNYDKNNGWESSIRPVNAGGSGGKKTTAQMVDLFPMADGLKPGQSPTYVYNNQLFFLNRDPRFYRTFAFPGERWAYNGDMTSLSTTSYPYTGSNYVLWSYVWYADAASQNADDRTGFAADGLATNNTSVFVRKRSDDLDVNVTPLYMFSTVDKFSLSAAPYMEIRYAEVLLNFAEAACGAGHPDEAVDALKQIRQRVGYTSTNNYGLDAALLSDQAKLFAAILYERQIELAYEGKRFDDMRRWMLWDGGVGQEALNPSWKLTGFGGNTCAFLGVAPLNSQRRTGVEIRVADNLGVAPAVNGNDPIIKKPVVRPAGLNLMTDATIEQKTGKPIDILSDFYRLNLTRKTTRVDGDPTYSITFQPKYYFLGFRSNMQQMNVTLKQTIGWADLENGGANGTYDPLAE